MAKTKKLSYSIFTNGISMSDLSKHFYSDWEANRFITTASNKNLIELADKGKKEYVHVLLYKKDLPENKTVINIDVFEDGTINKINHK